MENGIVLKIKKTGATRQRGLQHRLAARQIIEPVVFPYKSVGLNGFARISGFMMQSFPQP
ncbi:MULTISPECIES: hypothetical protein [Alcaligenes]|jgi:hypothetical protein|uniref:Uncharacterized protein n=1 Tax=Alcaligenes faecalis TaxID=511 RepID=A0ABY7N312_ALCFA|nr:MULTISPECIES: hypothetical protein [Alcaligenes]ARP51982.1 hypothetical protein ALFP_0095 [Alcaligenes faecalis]ATI01513.1 hypothetical protein CPY64_18105 [Alcaligenes faecalis]AYZ90868.1 hypothetical protein EGY22_04975 [Alcaligenes faecalis]KAA1285222.1 hypothetical protein D7S43_15040 [Alcaligenes faecalis]OSZ30499.1 hypothetical protein BVZ28_18585 [Alcaligenes faecalis]